MQSIGTVFTHSLQMKADTLLPAEQNDSLSKVYLLEDMNIPFLSLYQTNRNPVSRSCPPACVQYMQFKKKKKVLR